MLCCASSLFRPLAASTTPIHLPSLSTAARTSIAAATLHARHSPVWGRAQHSQSTTRAMASSSAPPAAAAMASSSAPAAAAAARTAVDEVSDKGEFKRTAAGFRSTIAPDGPHPPDAGRYHLYVSLACPWACRCLAALHLKGLQDVIGVSVVHPTWQRTRPDDPADKHTGWAFAAPGDPPLSSSTGQGSFPCDGCVPDGVNNARFIRDLYERSNDTTGKYSVPVLWDKQAGLIVNNESSDILRIFNSAFQGLAQTPELDLYPEALRAKIDEVNELIYESINNGVYRCGFATKQAAYESAFEELFGALDRVEGLLGGSRYLLGDSLTEADVRLFMTLIRFDEVYTVYFRANRQMLRTFPNLAGYTADLAQTPGIAASINMSHIKTHYYTSHPVLNTYAIIPVGGSAWWEDAELRRARVAQFPHAKKQAWDEA